MRNVIYAAIPYGYAVKVMENNKVVDEYTAGNSPRCSQTYVDPKDGLPLSRMREFAKQTAEEMAGDAPVEYSNDLEGELREMLIRSIPEDDMRMSDHAELWAVENGRDIPDRNTDEWQAMYEEWCAFAFGEDE